MKKKYREIVVNNKKYAWQASAWMPDEYGYGDIILTIWHNKIVISRFDYREFLTVTPKMVEEYIINNNL